MPIALVGTYLMKAACVALFRVRYPEGYLWQYPGFYSLTVSYGAANDMHFSVHVALLLLCFQEFRAMNFSLLGKAAFAAAIFESALGIFTRGAYSIDIFGAFIFGFFFWYVGFYLSYYIDVLVFGLTFQERFPHF